MFGFRQWGHAMYEVIVARDEDGRFFVLKSDIAGLHAEANSLDEMEEIIADLAPDLIRANHQPRPLSMLLGSIFGDRQARVRVSRELCLA